MRTRAAVAARTARRRVFPVEPEVAAPAVAAGNGAGGRQCAGTEQHTRATATARATAVSIAVAAAIAACAPRDRDCLSSRRG
jgi:hypothetical protein